MQSLSPPDSLHLLAAQGWLELGNHIEANAELEEISPLNRVHPDVLEISWHMYEHAKKWSACLDIANALVFAAPDRIDSWLNRSFTLHELNRTQEAFDNLLPMAEKFQGNWQLPYNLACYCSVLGRFDEAQHWLKKALVINEQVSKISVDDPDFEPLWGSMSGTIWTKE